MNRFTIERGVDSVRYGGLIGLTYEFNTDHRLHLTGDD